MTMTRTSRKASEYVKVYRFMTEGMGLSGTELLIYARVFGFSKLNGGEFWESKRGTAEFLGISERQVHRAFKGLEAKGLVREAGEHALSNGRITKRYEVERGPVEAAMVEVARRHPPTLFDP